MLNPLKIINKRNSALRDMSNKMKQIKGGTDAILILLSQNAKTEKRLLGSFRHFNDATQDVIDTIKSELL